MIKIIIVLLFGFVYVISLIPYLNIKEKKIKNNIQNVSVIVFATVFGLLFPINYILSIKGFNSKSYIDAYLIFDEFDLLKYYFAIFLVSHTFLLVLKRKKEINLYTNEHECDNNYFYSKKIIYTVYIVFFIGLISNILYLKAYGSYNNYLNYSGLIRSGVFQIDNKFSFLFPFRNCIIFSSYLFAIMKKRTKNKIINTIFLIISILLSVSILYANKGRLSIILYIVLLILALSKEKNKQYINIIELLKVALIGLIGGISILLIGQLMGRNNETSFVFLLNKEISFSFINFKKICNYCSLDNFRYFFDIIASLVFILPSSIWSAKFNIVSASTINTIAWFGSEKGANGIYGEMPIDFISLSYMQFGFLGIIILPLVWANFYNYLIKKIEKTIKEKSLKLFIEKYIIITIGIQSLFYADPYLIINREFGFIIFILIYYFLMIIENNKANKKRRIK